MKTVPTWLRFVAPLLLIAICLHLPAQGGAAGMVLPQVPELWTHTCHGVELHPALGHSLPWLSPSPTSHALIGGGPGFGPCHDRPEHCLPGITHHARALVTVSPLHRRGPPTPSEF